MNLTVLKVVVLSCAILSLLNTKEAQADVIMPFTHPVKKCVKISNIDEFPDTVLVGYITGPGVNGYQADIVRQNTCLEIGYKFNQIKIYAIPADYLSSTDLESINFSSDSNVLPSNSQLAPASYYITDKDPLVGEDITYKIAGFVGSELILYKAKLVLKYNDGTPDNVETYPKPNIAGLRTTIREETPQPTSPSPTPSKPPSTPPPPTPTPTSTEEPDDDSNSQPTPPTTQAAVTSTPAPAAKVASAFTAQPTVQSKRGASAGTAYDPSSSYKNKLSQGQQRSPDILMSPGPEPAALGSPRQPDIVTLMSGRSAWQILVCLIRSLIGFSC